MDAKGVESPLHIVGVPQEREFSFEDPDGFRTEMLWILHPEMNELWRKENNRFRRVYSLPSPKSRKVQQYSALREFHHREEQQQAVNLYGNIPALEFFMPGVMRFINSTGFGAAPVAPVPSPG